VVQFSYDARNRCVARTVNGNITRFVYDGWSMLEELNASGTEQARYYHGAMIDELLLRITANTYYYHHDGLGSTIALTDSTGALVESYTYDVFGAATIMATNAQLLAVSSVGNRFLFTGRECLAEIGLYDYRNRFYSPSLGRFLQTDPIGFRAQDVNLYRYVFGDPNDLLDPFGLDTINFYRRNTPDSRLSDLRTIQGMDANEITMGGHGNAEYLVDQRGVEDKPVDLVQLAEEIKQQPGYTPDKVIRDNSCDAAKGDNSRAEQLSRLLPNPIVGSSGCTTCGTMPVAVNGAIVQAASPVRPVDNAQWRTFRNGKEAK
jgi:RHS repeat-associated protein